jgi:hypothetical protein
MWAIKYTGTSHRSGFRNGIVALALDEQAVDSNIQKCVLKLKSESDMDPQWDALSEETGHHTSTVSYEVKNKVAPETFVFSAHELSDKDSRTETKIGTDEMKEFFSLLGFESEIDLLKNVTSEELWPLLFIQYSDEENWRNVVHDKLHLLSLKVTSIREFLFLI